MADGKRRLEIIIAGDAKGAVAAIDQTTAGAAKLGDDVESHGKRAGLGLAAIGAGAVIMAKGWVDAATESYKVGKQTEAVITSTGGAANVTAKDVDKLSTTLSRKTGVDDEVVASGENVLLTFTQVRNEVGKGNDVFNQATSLALDMSVALGTDMTSASMLLGKALNDPIKGITALTRSGVSFTEQQKDQIRQMVASGDTLGAQKLILSELRKEFEGSAEAQATAMGKLGVVAGNLQERLGGALLPAIDDLAGGATWLLDRFDALPESTQNVLTKMIAFGAVGLGAASGIAFVVGQAEKLQDRLGPLLPAMTNTEGGLNRMGKAVGALGLVGAVAGLAVLADSLNEVQVDANQMAAAIDRGSDASRRHVLEQLATADALGKTGEMFKSIVDQSVPAAQSILDYAEKNGMAKDQVAELQKVIDAKRTSDVQGAIDQKQYADEVQGAASAADELAGSLQDVADKLHAQFDPLFAAEDALGNLTQAQHDAAVAARDHGAGSTEAKEANEKAAKAALDYEGALLTLEDKVRQQPELLGQAKDALYRWVSQGYITKDTADQVAGSLDGIANNAKGAGAELDRLNGKKVNVTVTTTHKDDYYSPGTAAYEREHPRRAGGGRVQAKQAYIVGDRFGIDSPSAELFVPDRDGTIYPSLPPRASATPATAGVAAGAGIVVYATINMAGSYGWNEVEFQRRVADALAGAVQDGVRIPGLGG